MKNEMKRIIFLFCLMAFVNVSMAQRVSEQITAYTDKDCYLVGERLCVRVDVSLDGQPSPSRVAYVEVADTRQLYAQCMVMLSDGQGWAEIDLPASMHSGCYQLVVYTRLQQASGVDHFYRTLIGVINGERLSRYDDILFLPADSCPPMAQSSLNLLPQTHFAPGEPFSLTLPSAGCAVSVSCAEVQSLSTVQSLAAPQPLPASPALVPELEGHILRAQVSQGVMAEVAQSRLALIGKGSSLYDGVPQSDGSYLFYTHDVSGSLPVLVNAYDTLGHFVPMTLLSPYLKVLPQRLPRLTVYCDERPLLLRANAARQQAAISQQLALDTLRHTVGFMSAEPDFFYDLDEYTQMNDVRELLLEFVRGIRRQKHHGVNMLYTLDASGSRYSRWPALVLLDGLPVHDIDEILHYDAHLIRYVQIYNSLFSFGGSCCQGVISFITRGGRLSNYKLRSGEHLMSYAFPQDHPAFVNYTGSDHGTLLWMPVVQGQELSLAAPATPGHYQVVVQCPDARGQVSRHIALFEVR